MKGSKRLRKKKTLRDIERFTQKYPKTAAHVKKYATMNIRCRRCGTVVLKEPDIEEYPFYCSNCYENMYGVETFLGSPRNISELYRLMCYALSMELDDEEELSV
ncbi:MAG: hypothetical protein J6D52_03855 [Clostridia bacterium]|nr:hypothetical protein [Clostridia bacterium]